MKNKICNNYFSGPVSQISSCLEIILYNKSEIPERISLYNLESFYLSHLVGTSENYVKLYRDHVTDEEGEIVPFKYKKLLKNGFNILVYVSPVTNSPLGYSEFINTQGVGVSLDIRIDITRTLEQEIELILSNQLVGKDLSKTYLGNEIYQYTPRKELISRKYRNLFTSDIKRVISDPYSLIIGSSWSINDDVIWRIRFKEGIEVEENYTNHHICFYDGSPVIFVWENKNYSCYSLVSGEKQIEGSTGVSIKRIEGRYYLDVENKYRRLEDNSIIEKKKKFQFCDSLDPHCKVYDLPAFYSKSDILKYIPEINNIYLDLDNYLKSNQVLVCDKIGSWFILKRDFGGTPIYNAVSPTTSLIMTEEDLERAIFVGDQTVILCEEEEEQMSVYYVIYNTEGTELQTERARSILLNGRLDSWTFLDDNDTPSDPEDDFYVSFRFCFLDTEEDEVHFSEYYGENGLVTLVFEYEELYNTLLEKYRRNVYPESIGIPKLIGSFGGLIFYKEGNKINLL